MIKKISFILSVLTISLVVGYVLAAWTEPSASPPDGNVDAPINIGDTAQGKNADIWATGFRDSTGNYGIWPANASVTNTLAGDLTIGGGTGKINVGTIDPIFDIDGEKYATYIAETSNGVRVDFFGKAELLKGSDNQSSFNHVFLIDFDDLSKGSNLWIFSKIVDFGKNMENLNVVLTPEGKHADLYYLLDFQENQLIIYGNKQVNVSYRLSAPRFDHEKWGNTVDDKSLKGMKVE